jgi:hypothetical protein
MLCQEETVRARQGEVPAQGGVWVEARVKGEAAWAVRFRLARAGFAYALAVPTKRPTSSGNPAFRGRARSAADR